MPDRWGRPANHDRIVSLNLGLGRDSITMLCLASRGELRVKGLGKLSLEDLDYVVFSDTGREWPHTYDLLDRVRKLLGDRVPLFVLRKPKRRPPRPPGRTATGKKRPLRDKWRVASMDEAITKAEKGGYHYRRDIFLDYAVDRPVGPTFPGFGGDCTGNHKIGPMRRLMNDVSLLRFGQTNKKRADLVREGLVKPHLALIGIAADEKKRVIATIEANSDGTNAYVLELMPLVDMKITKADEVPTLEACGFADVRKSGCYMCKFQPPSWWWALSVLYPNRYAEVVDNERRAMRRNDRMNVTGAKIKGKLLTVPEVVAKWRKKYPSVTVAQALDKVYERDAEAARAAYKEATGVDVPLAQVKRGKFADDVVLVTQRENECVWGDDEEPDLIAMARHARGENPLDTATKSRLLAY